MKTAKPQNMVICCQWCVKTWDFEAHFFPGEYSLACLLFVYEIYKGVLRSRMAWKERNNHLRSRMAWKERNNHLKDFSLQSDKIFPYLLLGLLSLSILRLLRPFSLWIDTLLKIAPSFVRSIKVHFDQEWRERKGKNNLDNFCKPHPWKIPF